MPFELVNIKGKGYLQAPAAGIAQRPYSFDDLLGLIKPYRGSLYLLRGVLTVSHKLTTLQDSGHTNSCYFPDVAEEEECESPRRSKPLVESQPTEANTHDEVVGEGGLEPPRP